MSNRPRGASNKIRKIVMGLLGTRMFSSERFVID